MKETDVDELKRLAKIAGGLVPWPPMPTPSTEGIGDEVLDSNADTESAT